MGKKRKADDDPYETFDLDSELAMCGGVGSITTITETPKKRRKKVKHRPIGFMTDLDKMEDAE